MYSIVYRHYYYHGGARIDIYIYIPIPHNAYNANAYRYTHRIQTNYYYYSIRFSTPCSIHPYIYIIHTYMCIRFPWQPYYCVCI